MMDSPEGVVFRTVRRLRGSGDSLTAGLVGWLASEGSSRSLKEGNGVTNGRRTWLRCVAVVLISASVFAVLVAAEAPVGASDGGCERGTYSGGEYMICMPEWTWNGDLFVYAHGYVAPENPVGIPEDQLVLGGGTSITSTITNLGYAFATTSYITNGLAVREGVTNIVDLVDHFKTTKGVTPTHVYLGGASEGGAITALTIEQYPDVFDGGVSTCGPVGDFRGQITYWGDVRVVFDYFFPGVIPGTPLDIPQSVIDGWYYCGDLDRNPNYPCVSDESAAYETQVRTALVDDPEGREQLMTVAGIPVNEADEEASIDAVVQLLWYNVFATNDGVAKLGGQPFDNQDRWYSGSNDDALLNDPDEGVERISGEQAALDAIADQYETSGKLSVPLVTMHTTGDAVVPYWHATRYRVRVIMADNIALHRHIKVDTYGHCAFSQANVMQAFITLLDMVNNPPEYVPAKHVFLPSLTRGY